eukprot:s3403_g2.t1
MRDGAPELPMQLLPFPMAIGGKQQLGDARQSEQSISSAINFTSSTKWEFMDRRSEWSTFVKRGMIREGGRKEGRKERREEGREGGRKDGRKEFGYWKRKFQRQGDNVERV